MLIVSAACLALRGRNTRRLGDGSPPEAISLVPFFSGMPVLLAGFWMVATHVPWRARRFPATPRGRARSCHPSASLAVFALGLLWCTSHWGDLAAAEASRASARD